MLSKVPLRQWKGVQLMQHRGYIQHSLHSSTGDPTVVVAAGQSNAYLIYAPSWQHINDYRPMYIESDVMTRPGRQLQPSTLLQA